jgi:hypothetical protein
MNAKKFKQMLILNGFFVEFYFGISSQNRIEWYQVKSCLIKIGIIYESFGK